MYRKSRNFPRSMYTTIWGVSEAVAPWIRPSSSKRWMPPESPNASTSTAAGATRSKPQSQFLETADEYFDVSKSHHYQGRRMVYGMYLPDSVLEKIYYKNAMRLIPGA